MKRKLFTLLFALVALASFQVSAAPPPNGWWIWADTTGTTGVAPYAGDKTPSPWKNWLISTGTAKAEINTSSSILNDGTVSKFTITPVNENARVLNIKATGGSNLSLAIDGNNSTTQFEVVKFRPAGGTSYTGFGNLRTVQPYDETNGVEGYLMPIQGGNGPTLTDTTRSMWMVVANKDHGLEIKRVDQVFVKDAKGSVLSDSIRVPIILPIDWSSSEFDGTVLSKASGSADFIQIPKSGGGYYTASDLLWVSYQPKGLFEIGTYAYPGIKYEGNQNATNQLLEDNGKYGIVYLAADPTTTLLSGASLANILYNPDNLTAYIGTDYDENATAWAADIIDITKWTNGFPWNVSSGPNWGNSQANVFYPSQYVIFRVKKDDFSAKIGNPGVTVIDPATGLPVVNPTIDNGNTNGYGNTIGDANTYAFHGLEYTQLAINNQWRPVWIKLEAPHGRWATQADFPCPYTEFPDLYVFKSKEGSPYFETDTIRAFVVKQVDWIADALAKQSDQNMFRDGTDYNPNVKFYTANGATLIGGQKKGLQIGATTFSGTTADIIPLFTLASPEAGCGVVSVSRQNDLDIQSQGIGVYANKLEIRDYGYFYEYQTNGTYKKLQASTGVNWTGSNIQQDRVATSLQKFAFWIDENGVFTMYPAAAYAWEYGQDKTKEISVVRPNSVLLYNNIGITQTFGGTNVIDKGWGVKIGTWNGRTTANSTTADKKIISTVPNVIIDGNSDYTKLDFDQPKCYKVGLGEISGRFYFLDVLNPNVKRNTNDYFKNATALNGIQDSTKTTYVLSTEVVDRATGEKQLIMIPKEKVRRYMDSEGNKWYEALETYKLIEKGQQLPEYWANNPFDYVNMAAHWEIIEKGPSTFLLVNMLGDTLQYNPADGVTSIRGRYVPENEQIAGDQKFSPEGGTDNQWFKPTGGGTSYYADGNTKSLWTASALPGSEDDGTFVLSLGDYKLAGTGNWVPSNIKARTDSVYYKQIVKLSNPGRILPWTLTAQDDCAGGLILQKSPIYYVPNYSASYGGESRDATIDRWKTINTNDSSFIDGRVKQDSLTAYLLLHGTYGIIEASRVNNNLKLGNIRTEYLNSLNATNPDFAAGLTASGKYSIEFIPLAGSGRNEAITDCAPAVANATYIQQDKLYGETYKWFIVKDSATGKYLVYDTINPQADKGRYKVGLTWKTLDGASGFQTIANATPVRLYQPLVGDKLQGNFIFQFYVPNYTYNVTKANTYVNEWPASSLTDATDVVVQSGHRAFGELYKQSNYIVGVTELKDATRFTYDYQAPGKVNCDGCERFIDPAWMAQEKLISFPIFNRVWLQEGTQFSFSMAASKKADHPSNKNEHLEEATVSDASGFSLIKHTLVGRISGGVYQNYNAATKAYTTPSPALPAFKPDRVVYLYTVQDKNDQYLTVDTTTYQYNSRVTVPDVTGVNLVWGPKKTFTTASGVVNGGALQLFAITGIESDGPGEDGWYTDCGTFVYMPLASYKVDYTKGQVIKTAIYYNTNLGLGKDGQPCNDPSTSFRVSQYSPINGTQKNLIVANTTGGTETSIVPVEFKWKKEVYDEIPCDYKLVKNVNRRNTVARPNFYYAAGGAKYDSLCRANEYTILAHWQTSLIDEAKDNRLYQFTPENIVGYGEDIMKAIPEAEKQLTGGFYFRIIPELTDGTKTTVRAINFDNYEDNYTVSIDTFEITCVDHALPFANLEKGYTPDFSYVLPTQLAILESPPYVNRNLASQTQTLGPTPINNKSYQVYINPFEGNIKDAQYVSAYRTYSRRLLADGLNDDDTGHEIPYYAFSIKKNGREYFLNVHPAAPNTNTRDSVYWTAISAADSLKLLEGDGDADMKLFQFCLPYQVDENGVRKEVTYSDNSFNPTYLQTLDTDKDDYPYLVVTGASSQYVTARNLKDAMRNNTGCAYTNGFNSLDWNIYTVDYSQIDPFQVTAWIFAGEKPGENEWVPLRNAKGVNPFDNTNPDATIADFNTDGSLTNYALKPLGTTFVAESQMDPNYGILLGQDVDKVKLHFEYRGVEQIGTLWKVPIYYYQIQAPDSKGWLTDSEGKGTKYTYEWVDGIKYDYAYFDATKLTDMVNGTVAGTSYDKNYRQTFGLLYYTPETGVKGDYKSAEQTFVVVSTADFRSPKQNYDYRYLAEVNGRMVFVKGIENALVFQFGHVDGGYTNISVVGQGDVFGVSGGVRLLNQTGAVSLYTIDGRLIKSVDVTGADQTITAPRGVVIVKAAGETTKVVVK